MKSIKILRATAGLKSEELAKAAGISRPHLSRVECGRLPLSAPLALRLLTEIETALNRPAGGGS